MRKGTILNEEGYENDSKCRNCPYFINKLVCPFHRKNQVKSVISTNQEQAKKK